MSKLLANQISNYNDNGPVEAKDGINVANGKPFQVNGASGSSGEYLKSTGSSVAWTAFPTTLSGYGITDAFSGAYADLTGKPSIPNNISDLANVSVTAPSNNQVLKWNGSAWGPAADSAGIALNSISVSVNAVGASTLTYTNTTGEFNYTPPDLSAYLTSVGSIGSHTDVTISSVQNDQVLKYNSTTSKWENKPDATGSSDTNDYLSSASLSGNTLTLGRTGSQSLADLTVDLSSLGGGGATVTTDDSAPSSPSDGDLWWKSDEGRLKVYYADGSSNQWVDASPPAEPPATLTALSDTPANYTGAAGKYLRVNSAGNAVEFTNNIGGTMSAHIIPDTNAAYDLGNAEYKIRHLFLSDNTVYFQGSFLKVAQHDAGGSAQSASYLIPLAKLKDALNASGDYEAFKNAILAITDA